MSTSSPARTPEERQAAMDAFIADVRNTDDATQAEIEEGIDQMLERIYSTRHFGRMDGGLKIENWLA
jgi:hypothetical protein